jgi:hypothetical protein
VGVGGACRAAADVGAVADGVKWRLLAVLSGIMVIPPACASAGASILREHGQAADAGRASDAPVRTSGHDHHPKPLISRRCAEQAPRTLAAPTRPVLDGSIRPRDAIELNVAGSDRQRWEKERAGDYWQADGGFPTLGTSGLVFTTPVGTPPDSANVTHAFHDVLGRSGLPRMRFHDLRHGAASLMFSQGEDARTIMPVLGHSQISTTMDLYTHIMPSTMRDVAARMNSLLTATP